MVGTIERIQNHVVNLLDSEPNGLRHSEIVAKVTTWDKTVPDGTIFGEIYTLPSERAAEVYKPSRGVYRHTKFRTATSTASTISSAVSSAVGSVVAGTLAPTPVAPAAAPEDTLYKPFADYLVNELEECTRAIPLGGNSLGSKWGTPDVIGVMRARDSHIYKPTMEVVSVEVKIDAYQLIVAFGQACAYTLFSHRVYLVVPADSLGEDLDRLTSLCQIFGLGLVLADTSSGTTTFNVRLRAARHDPDSYYVNEVLTKVEAKLLH